MSAELSVVDGGQGGQLALREPFKVLSLDEIITLSKHLAASGYFKDAKDASQCVVKIVAGQEVGLPPMASMKSVFIIEGKPTFAYQAVGAIIKRSGLYDYVVHERSADNCKLEFLRRTAKGWESLGILEYGTKEAAAAGLVNKENWKRYPENYRFARAMTNGVNAFCPDVFMGPVYCPEELGAMTNGVGEVVIEESGGTSTQTVRQPARNVTPKPPKRTIATLQSDPDRYNLQDLYTEAMKARNKERKSAGLQPITVTPDSLATLLHISIGEAKHDFFPPGRDSIHFRMANMNDLARLWHILITDEVIPADVDALTVMGATIDALLAGKHPTEVIGKSETIDPPHDDLPDTNPFDSTQDADPDEHGRPEDVEGGTLAI